MEEKKCGRYEDEKAEAGSFEAFREIIAQLRGENGCPWDRAQTFESLKPCMVNEMTEALAAIDLYSRYQDAENLCEELGDVLLQVVMLSRIAEEQGLFSIDDVIRGVSKKMIRRHPHVFAGEKREAESSEPSGRWEAIKREEKKHRTLEQEQQEKAAFSEAAKWVIEQLREE